MSKLKIAIVTINKPSLSAAIKLNDYLEDFEADIYTSKKTAALVEDINEDIIIYDKLDDIIAPAWDAYDAIICILAMGAVVRKIAPFLKGKDIDPAVIVINLALDKVVPLLSGHIGGANELSDLISSRIDGCINFVSTATDQTKTIAFEMVAKQNDWKIQNLKALANISNRLLNKQIVKVATCASIFDSLPSQENLELIGFDNIDENTVVISSHITNNTTNLILQPKLTLGMGCNRDTPYEEINNAFLEFLDENNLAKEQIQNIASFEAKSDEIGLLEFAKNYDFDIQFYDKENINSLEQEFSKSSSTKFFGLKGVAEPSSVLASKYKELIIKKKSYFKSVTISAAI